jgi:putative hydrolase of the HAD superfamily
MTKTIVFDLDDTLYKEIDFVISGYNFISSKLHLEIADEMLELYFQRQNVFENIIQKYSLNIERSYLLELYRNHYPSLEISKKNKDLLLNLKSLGFNIGLATDGRSISQRNKLKALDIEDIFDLIIISEEIGSEKPNTKNFIPFQEFKTNEYYYIGDNVNKDFYGPNLLGWKTICLNNNGKNIEREKIPLNNHYLPHHQINFLEEIINYI